MLKTLEICGFRGFARKGTLNFAVPTKVPGSGLTILVGPNNSGKSTIIEILQALAQTDAISITQGRRNILAGDRVDIRVCDIQNQETTIQSIKPSSSETQRESTSTNHLARLFVVTSRRSFDPYFGQGAASRDAYIRSFPFQPIRNQMINIFSTRLFQAFKNQDAFNQVLKNVIDPVPDWSIDQHDTGQYFLKFTTDYYSHSSEGLGEGLISLFYIIDALYDSQPGDTIAIDEPELSLHPAYQRKLMQLFIEYSKDRQIILSTHSPYFVQVAPICKGGTLGRVYIENKSSTINQIQSSTVEKLSKLLENDNNPHILGLNAQEVFFLEDGVILLEGQEDLVFIQRALDSLKTTLNGNFFGWGVGGAGNMETIVQLLRDLGFKKVAGILDNNKETEAERLGENYPDYYFQTIPANDIRTKPSVAAKDAVQGLLDESNKTVRSEYVEAMSALIQSTNDYLSN